VGAPPRVAVDPVPDSTGNFAFGDQAAYLKSLPPRYMHDGAIAAWAWQRRATGFDGFRIDDVKGTYAPLIWDALHSPDLADCYAFGEYFDGQNAKLWNWVHGYMTGRASCLDFGFKFNVGDICNNNSRSWMGALVDIGYCMVDPANAVTFLESADTDNSPGEQVVWNKMLGYAVLLTFPGYPRVYYRDWSTDAGCYGLKDKINNLVWIHEHLAGGDFVVRLDTDYQVFVQERLGYGAQTGCLCAYNNDQWNSYTRTVQTNFGPNQRVHEYTGNGPYLDLWTDAYGRLTFSVPRNDNGMGYVVYALPEVQGASNAKPPLYTTQQFEGAADPTSQLDLPPLKPGINRIGRILCAKGSTITSHLYGPQGGVSFLAPDNTSLDLLANLPADGFYTAMVTIPQSGADAADYWLKLQYLAPQTYPKDAS
jgi:alpha-amylase